MAETGALLTKLRKITRQSH